MKRSVLILALFICTQITACIPRNVTFWHWLEDRHDFLNAAAEQYKKETGVSVDVKLISPTANYKSAIDKAMKQKNLPDIFGVLEGMDYFTAAVQDGHIFDISKILARSENNWQKDLYYKASEARTFKENNQFGVPAGTYGIPFDINNILYIYNKKLFAEAGIKEPPRTFAEFITALKKLKNSGVTPFVAGFAENWLVNCFVDNYAWNLMGKTSVINTYKGDKAYTSDEWISVFQNLKQLAEFESLRACVDMTNATAEKLFAEGKAAIIFDGSWIINIIANSKEDIEFGVFTPPLINEENRPFIWGGAGTVFSISKRSWQKKEALDFLKYLTSYKAQTKLAKQTNNIPVNIESLLDISPKLAQFARKMKYTIEPDKIPFRESSEFIQFFDENIRLLLKNEIESSECVQKLQMYKENR